MSKDIAEPVIDIKQRNKSRFMLIAIAVLFLIPIIGPFFWTPKSFVNHGDLIEPQARPLDSIKLLNHENDPAGVKNFQGKWTMMIVDHASCDERCQTNLYNIRQVRLTQGRRMKRVQLAWIVLSGDNEDINAQIQQDYPMIERYNIPQDQYDAVNELFKTQFGLPKDNTQRVYFVDPFGNLVMSFAAEQNPKEIQKDLGRLLRVSKAGENQ